jgi:hypothetical protein
VSRPGRPDEQRHTARVPPKARDGPEGHEKTKRQKALDAMLGMGREIIVGVATNVVTGPIPT